jgi:hypothetical protein
MAKDKSAKETAEHFKQGEGFVDVTMSRPIKVDGAETSVVRMREPTVADMEASGNATGNDVAKEITLISNLCEIAPKDIRALPFRDWLRLQAALALFTD